VTGAAPRPVLVEHVTVDDGGITVLKDVSFTIERGSTYAILGRGPATSLLLACLAGKRAVSSGRISILGHDPRALWRLRRRRTLIAGDSGLLAEASRRHPPEVLLWEPPGAAGAELAAVLRLRELASRGSAIVIGTDRVALTRAVADRIGVLARGRILAEGSPEELSTRFHRIRYTNHPTETRTEFGTELDAFDALRVQVRGWGITAVVSNFTTEAFERFRHLDGVEDAEAEAMGLEELVAELS
jgi:ABC-type multidrug transport system ATPase subunit